MDTNNSKSAPGDLLRIIDANINRIGEGLRVLEDIARMHFNDTVLSSQLKDMRHSLQDIPYSIKLKTLNHRDAAGDVGAFLETSTHHTEMGLYNFIVANSKRVQQATRVVEEIAKTESIGIDSDKYKKARFELYTLERDMLSKFMRQGKQSRIKGLCVVIDSKACQVHAPVQLAQTIIDSGAQIIMLNRRKMTDRYALELAFNLSDACAKSNTLFIVDSRADIAGSSSADGLLLGNNDLSITAARNCLPFEAVIGIEVFKPRQAAEAASAGADFISTGPLLDTDKDNEGAKIDVDTLKAIRSSTHLPLVAFGGINRDNIDLVISSGADSVAIASSVTCASNPAHSMRELSDYFR